MKFRIPTTLGNASIYFFGSALNGIVPLALAPVFTRHLTPEDYGLVATAMVLMNIFSIFQGINARGLIARVHFDKNSDHLRQIVSTATWFSLLLSIVLLALVFLFGEPLATFASFPANWLPWIVVLGFIAVVRGNYEGMLQARKEPLRFIANQSLECVLNAGLSVLLVVGLNWDWRGRMTGSLVAGGLVACLCAWGMAVRLGLLRFEMQRAALREILHFSIPLIPHVLGGWVMTMSTRLFLNNMASVADTGLFSLAYNLAGPLNIATASFNKTFYPWLFEKLSHEEQLDKVRLCRRLLLLAAAMPVGGALFGLGVNTILPWLVGPEFYGAAPYVFWLSLAMATQGIYMIFGNFIIYSKKTHLMAWQANFLGGLVVLISCPLLISWLGPIGAAIANFLGVAASAVGCLVASLSAFPMPWKQALLSWVSRKTAKNSSRNNLP